MNFSTDLLFLSLFACVALASYEDARCKCVCVDRHGSYNATRHTGKIFVKAIAADQCNCHLMLGPESALCPYCECKYQVRNTTTIKVVVCLILVVISALTLYMIFLLLLEPLLSSRRSGYKETTLSQSTGVVTPSPTGELPPRTGWFTRMDDGSTDWTDAAGERQLDGHLDRPLLCISETELDTETRQRVPLPFLALAGPSHPPGVTTTGGVSTVVKSVRDQQQRWKGNVEAQRARVFSEHTLLN